MLSVVSMSDIPAAKRYGEHEDRPKRQAFRCFSGGNAEETDLGRSIESQPKQHAQGIHVPAASDHAEHGAKHSREKTSTAE